MQKSILPIRPQAIVNCVYCKENLVLACPHRDLVLLAQLDIMRICRRIGTLTSSDITPQQHATLEAGPWEEILSGYTDITDCYFFLSFGTITPLSKFV